MVVQFTVIMYNQTKFFALKEAIQIKQLHAKLAKNILPMATFKLLNPVLLS